MERFTSFASVRVNAFLCSGLPLLLAACGGAGSDSTGEPARTAAYVQNSPAAQSDLTLSVAAAGVDGAAGSDSQAKIDPRFFDLAGYDSNPLEAESGSALRSADSGSTDAAAKSAAPSIVANYAHLYVSPDGSDQGMGTKASPFKTIARADQAARPRTIIFVAPGLYEGGFTTKASGIASGRIIFVSTVRHGAQIVAPRPGARVAWTSRGDFVSLIGFEINGTTPRMALSSWKIGIYHTGSDGMIKANHVHHMAANIEPRDCATGGAAIIAEGYQQGKRIDVIGNAVHDIGAAGPTSCRTLSGIIVSTSGNVKNNVVYRASGTGIGLYPGADDVAVTNNTVVAANAGIFLNGRDRPGEAAQPDHIAVYSNIVVNSRVGVIEYGAVGKHNGYRNNLVYGNQTDWRLQDGAYHTGTVSADPRFVAYTTTQTDLHLTSASPAIGRATPELAEPTDAAGKPRNDATGYDIGAYQH